MPSIKCKFCGKVYPDADAMAAHLEKAHIDMIPPDMDAYQFYYYMKTGKTHGNCVMCKKPTGWNPKTKKYKRFCDNPKCKIAYREMFKKRMIGSYGKITLLNDPEQQKKMLEGKKFVMTAKAGQGGRLFGSVTSKEIAVEMKNQFGIDIDRRKITVNDIKAFGTYPATVKLYQGVTAEFKVAVSEA